MARSKHTVEVAKVDLDINEELSLHEKGWIIQRIGWGFILVVIIAGALGVFGSGSLVLELRIRGMQRWNTRRYFRYETEMRILVTSEDHISSLSMGQEYLKDFRMLRIIPEPSNNTTSNNEVVYNFLPGQNKIVSVYLVPKEYGRIKGVMKINAHDSFQLNHLIYP